MLRIILILNIFAMNRLLLSQDDTNILYFKELDRFYISINRKSFLKTYNMKVSDLIVISKYYFIKTNDDSYEIYNSNGTIYDNKELKIIQIQKSKNFILLKSNRYTYFMNNTSNIENLKDYEFDGNKNIQLFKDNLIIDKSMIYSKETKKYKDNFNEIIISLDKEYLLVKKNNQYKILDDQLTDVKVLKLKINAEKNLVDFFYIENDLIYILNKKNKYYLYSYDIEAEKSKKHIKSDIGKYIVKKINNIIILNDNLYYIKEKKVEKLNSNNIEIVSNTIIIKKNNNSYKLINIGENIKIDDNIRNLEKISINNYINNQNKVISYIICLDKKFNLYYYDKFFNKIDIKINLDNIIDVKFKIIENNFIIFIYQRNKSVKVYFSILTNSLSEFKERELPKLLDDQNIEEYNNNSLNSTLIYFSNKNLNVYNELIIKNMRKKLDTYKLSDKKNNKKGIEDNTKNNITDEKDITTDEKEEEEDNNGEIQKGNTTDEEQEDNATDEEKGKNNKNDKNNNKKGNNNMNSKKIINDLKNKIKYRNYIIFGLVIFLILFILLLFLIYKPKSDVDDNDKEIKDDNVKEIEKDKEIKEENIKILKKKSINKSTSDKENNRDIGDVKYQLKKIIK